MDIIIYTVAGIGLTGLIFMGLAPSVHFVANLLLIPVMMTLSILHGIVWVVGRGDRAHLAQVYNSLHSFRDQVTITFSIKTYFSRG